MNENFTVGSRQPRNAIESNEYNVENIFRQLISPLRRIYMNSSLPSPPLAREAFTFGTLLLGRSTFRVTITTNNESN